MAAVALLGVLIAGEFDCETSDEFVSDGWGVCANATALSSNAAATLNDEIVFMECSCVQSGLVLGSASLDMLLAICHFTVRCRTATVRNV